MAKMQIKIANGKIISAVVDGVKGPSCQVELRKYLAAAGAKLDDYEDKPTPEFFEQPQVENQQQGQG